MEYKITEHRDIDSLEFELLTELPKLRVLDSLITDDKKDEKTNFLKEIKDRLDKITEVNEVFEVMHEIEDGFICVSYNYPFLFIKDCSKMEIGEVYFNYDDVNYIKVGDDFIDDIKSKEFFSEMDKWVNEGELNDWGNDRGYSDELVDIKEINGGEINFKIVEEKFNIHKKEIEAEEKADKERKKIKEAEKIVKDNNEEEIYNSKGEGKFNDISVVGKVIKNTYNDDEYILLKDISKTFSYNEMRNENFGRDMNKILSNIESFLNYKKITYTKKNSNGKGYKVIYINDKCKINDISIPQAKIRFVLNKINYKGATKDEIKILIKLNGMKADFISLENLETRVGNNLKIPIINKAIDDKTFEVEFLGKKKTFDWDWVKKWFFYNGSSRSLNHFFDNKKLLNFCGEMGVDKKDLFKNLRRLKMLNALKNEDDK